MNEMRREEDKKKLIELIDGFSDAYIKYLYDSANEEKRMTKEQFFVEHMLNNGMMFERVGHWVCGDDDQDYWACSECGFPVMAADDLCDPYEAEIEYCEKCGTRMVKHKKK